ncbi:MAG TPA: hypothetical protein VMQ60_06915 [Acidobacteriaceae bacterium]|jgi:hypothetical protein|nr:hypothetical protein [Acidobacteriaceae bacterium]
MHNQPDDPSTIQLPRPTAWPMVLALGLSLIFAGMVTSLAVGILGLLLIIAGIVGWFRQVLPHEAHVSVPIRAEQVEIVSLRTLIQHPPHAASESPRKILPVETFLISNGIKGGIAGGTAMVVPATIFSLLKYHSLWYSVNLLAAGGFVSWSGASNAFLSQFHLQGVLAGFLIQGIVSLLVGLLYGAMLPMFPKYPIFTAGFMVPLLFTGIVYSALSIVSPILNQRIDWFWFILSQFAFGLVCGFVVNLQARVRTPQFQALPFAMRAGLHVDQEQLDLANLDSNLQPPVNPTDKTDGRP